MNTLSDIAKQLSELVTSLSPSARIMAGLMVGVIVVSLGWIVSSEMSGDYESLLGGVSLTNTELDRIEAAFGDAQLRDYQREGRQIRIPNGQKDVYLKALSAANALPMEHGSATDRAFESTGVFDSTEKLHALLQTGEERDLANMLERLPGIEFAAVHIDEQRKGFGRQTEKVCTIGLQGPFNQPIPQTTLERIASFLSTHFAGLPKSNISVMDLGTANVFRESSDPHSASQNPVLEARKQWESYLHQKIGLVLVDYGAVSLMVDVEIDPTLIQEEEKLAYDPTAVTLQSVESRKDSENTKASPAGPPGSDVNGIGNKAQRIDSASAGQSSKVKESEANERRVAGHDATRSEKAGLTPTKVAVSIGVPESHYRKVFNHRYLLNNPTAKAEDIPAPTAQELTDLKTEIEGTIRSAVETVAMGIRDGDDRKPFVNVYTRADPPPPEFPQPSLASTAATWLGQSWSTLALLLVVLVSLGMMFSWIKSQGESDSDRKFAEGFGLQVPENMGDQLDIGEEEDETLAGKQRSSPEFEVSGGEMKEDLSALIKQNPDAVVNLLKTWIGDAA